MAWVSFARLLSRITLYSSVPCINDVFRDITGKVMVHS